MSFRPASSCGSLEVEGYPPRGYVSVDVNEDNAAILADGVAHPFETTEKLVLGYYRRKRG